MAVQILVGGSASQGVEANGTVRVRPEDEIGSGYAQLMEKVFRHSTEVGVSQQLMQPIVYTLGFQVMASVEGKKDFQPISQRYTSRSAAESYRDLAVKQGFKDAWVHQVEGFEPDPLRPRKQRKEVRPKQD